jgi:hypothetical protein
MSENKVTQQDLELGSIPGILAIEEIHAMAKLFTNKKNAVSEREP